MKKFTKVCLILAAILAGAGLIICIVGFAMGASSGEFWTTLKNTEGVYHFWGDYEYDGTEWKNAQETQDSFPADSVTKLEIELQYGEIRFEKSSTNEIVVLVEKNNGKFTATMEGGTLKLKDTRKNQIGNAGYVVTVQIPEDKEFTEIDIENNAGTVNGEDILLKAGTIDVNVDAGEAYFGEMTAGEVELKTGAGDTRIEKLDAGILKADCGVGNMEITLTDSENAYNYSVQCGVGDIRINNNHYSSFGGKKNIDNGATKRVELDCGVGNIELYTN